MRTLIPALALLAACHSDGAESAPEIRVYGTCKAGIVDIPIGWDVVAVIAHGVYETDAGNYYAAEIEIVEWDADRFSVAYDCPAGARSVNVWLSEP